MLIFYIRAVALLEIAFAVTQLAFGQRAVWLVIVQPRAGLSALELVLGGGYQLPDVLPTVVAVVLFVGARRIVGTTAGLASYVVFESAYLLGWGAFLIRIGIQPNFDGSAWSISGLINYTSATCFLASAVPLILAVRSLGRLRGSLVGIG